MKRSEVFFSSDESTKNERVNLDYLVIVVERISPIVFSTALKAVFVAIGMIVNVQDGS